MSLFDYKLNRRQQLVKKGEMIDNNIDFSGRTNTDFTNKFVAKMRDTNNLYTRESPGQFDDQKAEVVRKNLITQADDMGQFNDPSQQVRSDAFLAKFRNSVLVPTKRRSLADKVSYNICKAIQKIHQLTDSSQQTE